MNAAVILMAYGSPATAKDVPAYLADIREGRPVSQEAIDELAERYRRIGGRSPLDEITEAQRAGLERELGLPVLVGMKHWRPRIIEAVEAALSGGADTLVGLVLAPHYSRLSIAGYRERLDDALQGRAKVIFVESWHDHGPFLDVLASRVRGFDGHVVFTAHSLPERILRDGDPYPRRRPRRALGLVVRVPERERDRRAVARPGHPGGAGPARGERGPASARLPRRLRLGSSGNPLGPRHRGA